MNRNSIQEKKIHAHRMGFWWANDDKSSNSVRVSQFRKYQHPSFDYRKWLLFGNAKSYCKSNNFIVCIYFLSKSSDLHLLIISHIPIVMYCNKNSMVKKSRSEAVIDRAYSELSVSKSGGMVFDVCVPKVWKRRKEVRKRPTTTKTEKKHEN